MEDPLALDVVLEPAAEPWPGAGERFVGDLEDSVVAGDEPGLHESVDELVLVTERWCRIRCPSTSSSSHPRSRGQARASASWAISTTPSSLVTRRVRTSRSTSSSWSGGGDDLAAGDAGADGLALLSGGDEPEEEVVQRLALSGLEVAVQLLGGLGDRAPDPAGGLVAGDGEGASFAA